MSSDKIRKFKELINIKSQESLGMARSFRVDWLSSISWSRGRRHYEDFCLITTHRVIPLSSVLCGASILNLQGRKKNLRKEMQLTLLRQCSDLLNKLLAREINNILS